MKKLLIVLAALVSLSLVSSALGFSGVNIVPNTSTTYATWSTDANCTSQIAYGKTSAYGSTATNYTKSLSHGVTVFGLVPNTTYHYKLLCRINSTTYNSDDGTFTTLEAFPDLYIKGISATPSVPTLGVNVSVKITVGNSGDIKASGVQIGVTCPNGAAQSATIASINPGSTSTATVNCPPPSSVGSYTISATADPGNSIRESNEANNAAQMSVAYAAAPMPDLVISNGDITHTLKEVGGSLTATLKIYVGNIGTAKASNVWVEVENEGGGTEYAKISSLSAGGRASVSVTLPQASGHFTVIVDSNNTIAESDESNNVAEHEISATSVLPDLLVGAMTHSPSSPKTGQSVVISAVITNNGSSAAQNVLVRFVKVEKLYDYETNAKGETGESELGTGKAGALAGLIGGIIEQERMKNAGLAGATVSGPVFANVTVASIAPGQSKTVKATMLMPDDTESVLVAVIADPDNAISESDKSNNLATQKIDIQLLYPDLAVNASDISFTPSGSEVGDTLKVYATVKNSGALAAKNVPVRFFISSNGNDYQLVKNMTIPSIAAHGSSRQNIGWAVPSGVDYADFMVDVNGDRKIIEKNYANNNASKEIKILLPDLEVSGDDIWVTGNVAVGSNVVLKANVSNLGGGKAEGVAVDFFYLGSDGNVDFIGFKTITLNAGSRTTVSQPWTVPSGISPNQVIIVWANSQKAQYESDFGNNRGTLSLNAKLPDLQVAVAASRQTATIPDSPSYVYYVPFTVSIHNGGNDKAQNVLVRINVDGAKAQEQVIPSIAAGGNSSLTYNLRIGNQITPGPHTVGAVIDPAGTLTEATRDNNEDETTITLVANQPPNAVISVDDSRPLKNQLVTFNCENSTDPDSPPGMHFYTCAWDFGDGSDIEYGHEVTHSYPLSQAYTAYLNVTDTMGGQDITHTPIIVKPNQLPVANAGGPYTAYTNQPVSLDPTASYDPDGSLVSADWIFGDGTHADNQGFWPIDHTYTYPGTYNLALTVHDDSGAPSGTVMTTVGVVNPPPMSTKTGTQYYVSHHYHSPWEAGPQADVWYGVYKVDYSISYTQTDHVIKSLTYTITPGPAIVTAVSDADEESMWLDLGAVAAHGKVSMQVQGVEIRDADGNTLWSATGGPHISASEPPGSMSYAGIDAQPAVWNDQNYVLISTEITYPADMCMAEQYDCQYQPAVWIFP
jgi:subtilase family serine protease